MSAPIDGAWRFVRKGDLYTATACEQRHAAEGFTFSFELEKTEEGVVMKRTTRSVNTKELNETLARWVALLEKADGRGGRG
jgi:hypothetical protein